MPRTTYPSHVVVHVEAPAPPAPEPLPAPEPMVIHLVSRDEELIESLRQDLKVLEDRLFALENPPTEPGLVRRAVSRITPPFLR